MPSMRLVLRRVALGSGALLGLVLVVLLAWVASNWVDDAPVPTPPQLLLGPHKAGSPLFFAIQGMLAPPGQQPEAAGRAQWQQPTALGAAGPVAAEPAASAPAGAARLPALSGEPLSCRHPEDCPRKLAAASAQIVNQLQAHVLLGERCVAALVDPRYEEALPLKLTASTPLPAYQGATSCAHWFKGQALVAAAAGDRNTTLARLQQGRSLADALLGGSHTLISKMIAVALTDQRLDAVAAVALLHPEWTPELLPLTAALPAGALDATGWIKTEAAFVRGTIEELSKQCDGHAASLASTFDTGWGLVDMLMCKTGVGLLPNATVQAVDREWLERWTFAQQGLDTLLDQSIAQAAQQPSGNSGYCWRNSFGALLAESPLWIFGSHIARQADVETHRQLLALALAAQAQKLPLAQRAAWLDQQGLAPRVRARLSWSNSGTELIAKPWMAEFPGTDPRRADRRLAVAAP